jgi:hypothetical protein
MVREKYWDEYMNDAINETTDFFNTIVQKIDNKFGKGFAKSNPNLIGDFLNATTKQFSTNIDTIQLVEIYKAIQLVANSIECINSIDISTSLDDIANAIENIHR